MLYEDISDHFPCVIGFKSLMVSPVKKEKILKIIFEKNIYESMKSDLLEINWNDKLLHLNVNE